MFKPTLAFRSANPTFQEGKLFALYLDQAAEGFFSFMLGRHSEKIIAKAYLQPDHDLSYQHVTFAEKNQTIVGMVSGYPAEKHHQASDQPLKQAAGNYNLRFTVISTLVAPMMRFIDTIADGDFYLQAIAVNKEYRGEGLGSALLDRTEHQALAAGAKRLSLDVSADNVAAHRLYKRRGMVVESQWPKRIYIPKLKLYRMTKVLKPTRDTASTNWS